MSTSNTVKFKTWEEVYYFVQTTGYKGNALALLETTPESETANKAALDYLFSFV